MTQRTRNIIANILLGASIVTVIVFVVTHFTSPARPPWRRDLVFLGLAAAGAVGPVRGRHWRRAMQAPD
jgi:hypothetical protein